MALIAELRPDLAGRVMAVQFELSPWRAVQTQRTDQPAMVRIADGIFAVVSTAIDRQPIIPPDPIDPADLRHCSSGRITGNCPKIGV